MRGFLSYVYLCSTGSERAASVHVMTEYACESSYVGIEEGDFRVLHATEMRELRIEGCKSE